jgi:hypothetical protein
MERQINNFLKVVDNYYLATNLWWIIPHETSGKMDEYHHHTEQPGPNDYVIDWVAVSDILDAYKLGVPAACDHLEDLSKIFEAFTKDHELLKEYLLLELPKDKIYYQINSDDVADALATHLEDSDPEEILATLSKLKQLDRDMSTTIPEEFSPDWDFKLSTAISESVDNISKTVVSLDKN